MARRIDAVACKLPWFQDKEWAVVHDLRPFGFRIDRTCRSSRRATQFAQRYPWLEVMRTYDALVYNSLSRDDAEFFESELHRAKAICDTTPREEEQP